MNGGPNVMDHHCFTPFRPGAKVSTLAVTSLVQAARSLAQFRAGDTTWGSSVEEDKTKQQKHHGNDFAECFAVSSADLPIRNLDDSVFTHNNNNNNNNNNNTNNNKKTTTTTTTATNCLYSLVCLASAAR